MLTLTIPGNPVPKGRPRARVVNGKFAQLYTPKETREYEDKIAALVHANGHVQPVEGPATLHVVAVMKRPQRLCRKRDKDGLLPAHDCKVDLDNIVKAVSDGLQKSGVLPDDRQIVEVRAWKFYAERSGSPRVEVVLEPWSEP